MDELDLVADLNAQDDDGLGWSTLADSPEPSRVRPGAMLLAGNRQAQAVVRVVAVDGDGTRSMLNRVPRRTLTPALASCHRPGVCLRPGNRSRRDALTASEFCVFIAENEEAVAAHSELSGFPVHRVNRSKPCATPPQLACDLRPVLR